MKYPRLYTLFIIILLSSLLYACSGGEGGTGATTEGDISRGQITGFGSIFVNGVEFETTNSAISLDGDAGGESDLRLGMVVTVNGTINPDGLTGTANSVSVDEVIRGLIQANDGVNTLTVLNHTVELPSNVRFDGVADITGLATLVDFVEISGYVTGDGVISASRVELLGAGETESKLIGTISNVDNNAKTFMFGPTLIINFSGVDVSDFPNNQLADNLFVKVKGSFDTGTGILTAISVEDASISDVDVGEMEVEGFVTSVNGTGGFVIGDVSVQTDAMTSFEGGSIDEIIVGLFVEVEGALVGGVLNATEVEFDDSVRIEGVVATFAANTLTLSGLNGLTIITDSLTDFAAGLPGGLTQGTTIKVRGFHENSTTVVARRIETTTAANDVSLQGLLTQVISPLTTIQISGVQVDTTNPNMVYLIDGEIKTADEFYSSLDADEDLVEAKGVLSGSTIEWVSVELID